MKNRYKYIVFGVLVLFTVTSCEDYLDKAPNAEMPEEEVFRDPAKFKQFQADIYSYLNGRSFGVNRSQWDHGSWMYGGLGRIRCGSFDAFTDLAKATEPGAPTSRWARGDWGVSMGTRQELVLPYTEGYKAIRKCNQVLENIHLVENLTPDEIEQFIGESLFMRAFFYFEMIKRYGGVPYIDKVLTLEDELDLPRDTYDYCVERIVEDLDMAAELLPVTSQASDLGRPTMGAAMAYKARTLLYYASPLNNPENIRQRWIDAAQAAYDVIALNLYSLNRMENWDDQFYRNENPERIFQRLEDAKKFEANTRYGWTPPSMWHGAPGLGTSEASGNYPTQNFVDMFEMEDGSVPIRLWEEYNGLNPVINPESGYTEETMYENRDPRFYQSVAYNGMLQWFNPREEPRPIELFTADYSQPGNPSGRHTSTTRENVGYLSRKMWPSQFYAGSSEEVYMPWVFFRYAEILMIYAEAMNEAYGPDVDGLSKGLTARQALNQVRNRDLTGSKRRDVKVATGDQAGLRERIMNENAVEFYLEEHRFWDVVRWKKGVEVFNKPVYRIRIIIDENGKEIRTRELLETHVFYDYMHRYPLPKDEVEKSVNLVQNPGWEVTE